jgi:hypothetical protein
MAEIVLLDICRNCFGVTLRPVRLVVEIHIIWAKAVQGHVWSPSVIPELKFVAQSRQMINAFDDGNPF